MSQLKQTTRQNSPQQPVAELPAELKAALAGVRFVAGKDAPKGEVGIFLPDGYTFAGVNDPKNFQPFTGGRGSKLSRIDVDKQPRRLSDTVWELGFKTFDALGLCDQGVLRFQRNEQGGFTPSAVKISLSDGRKVNLPDISIRAPKAGVKLPPATEFSFAPGAALRKIAENYAGASEADRAALNRAVCKQLGLPVDTSLKFDSAVQNPKSILSESPRGEFVYGSYSPKGASEYSLPFTIAYNRKDGTSSLKCGITLTPAEFEKCAETFKAATTAQVAELKKGGFELYTSRFSTEGLMINGFSNENGDYRFFTVDKNGKVSEIAGVGLTQAVKTGSTFQSNIGEILVPFYDDMPIKVIRQR